MARNNSMKCNFCDNPSIKTRFLVYHYCESCEQELKDNFRYIELEMEGAYDSIVDAACQDYCQVEPDGFCPHKCPSMLVLHEVI